MVLRLVIDDDDDTDQVVMIAYLFHRFRRETQFFDLCELSVEIWPFDFWHHIL